MWSTKASMFQNNFFRTSLYNVKYKLQEILISIENLKYLPFLFNVQNKLLGILISIERIYSFVQAAALAACASTPGTCCPSPFANIGGAGCIYVPPGKLRGMARVGVQS